MRATDVVESVRTQLAPVRDRVRGHPYLTAAERRRLEPAQLRPFVGEQFLIISSDLRSMAQMVSRFGGDGHVDFFLDLLSGERAALQALPALATALAMGPEDLLEYEPLPGAQAYSAYTSWLAAYASDAEVAAAFAVNFQGWSESCARLGRALRVNYGLGGAQAAFFELFAEPSEDFEERALQVVEAGLQRGIAERLIRRAPRMLQGYEAMFWDTLYESVSPSAAPLSGSPAGAGQRADLDE
jgi:pyrroloquinoline quinone (PQQ) biosynthesis protein C